VDTASTGIREHAAAEQIDAYVTKHRCRGADYSLFESSVPPPERAARGRVLSEALLEFCLSLACPSGGRSNAALSIRVLSANASRLNKIDFDVLPSVTAGPCSRTSVRASSIAASSGLLALLREPLTRGSMTSR
jgi:hypothetical protein